VFVFFYINVRLFISWFEKCMFIVNYTSMFITVSSQAKGGLLGVTIGNHVFAYVNSLISPGSEYVRYMTLSQL